MRVSWTPEIVRIGERATFRAGFARNVTWVLLPIWSFRPIWLFRPVWVLRSNGLRAAATFRAAGFGFHVIHVIHSSEPAFKAVSGPSPNHPIGECGSAA
jgi:hypothetical protein